MQLISPRHVKPFVLNNKTDAADAQAIYEVVRRLATRFVNVKIVAQQDMSAWHRIRERKVKERTALVNQIRALLMEQRLVIPKSITHVRKLLPSIIEEIENGLSWQARDYLSALYSDLMDVNATAAKYESKIMVFTKTDEACKRLQKIPGVGPRTVTAIVAHVGNATQFKNARAFTASLGLTPKEHSSDGKQKLLGVSKLGNCYIRKLLIQEAHIVTRYALLRRNLQAPI